VDRELLPRPAHIAPEPDRTGATAIDAMHPEKHTSSPERPIGGMSLSHASRSPRVQASELRR
jgi:hypothetical protein